MKTNFIDKTIKSTMVVRSRSRSCGGGDICGTTPAFFFFLYCAGQRLAPNYRTLGDLEWEVESTTVTHSSPDWWDLLLPLA